MKEEQELTAVEILFNIWLNREYITEDEWLEAIELEKEQRRYSEEDMVRFFEYGWNQRHYGIIDEIELSEIKNSYLQSLQRNL